jgi:hypothetical protein
MGQLLMLQKGRIKLLEERNKPLEEDEEQSEERKVSIKKKSKVPKKSAEEYMAYLNMQGSARFGV